MPPGKRSRINDVIMLFDSPTLAAKLKDYSEEHKFYLNTNFSITIKGGERGPNGSMASAITTSVLNSANASGYNPTVGYR